MSQSSRRPPRNPLAWPLAWLGMALLVCGAAIGLNWTGEWAWVARPLLLANALVVLAYTGFALRQGWIATISSRGQVQHFQRRKQPVIYWLLVTFYLALALPTAIYLGDQCLRALMQG